MTNSNFNFNQKLFTENFDKFMEEFNGQDAHPESFYEGFYDEFIAGSKFLTDEIKKDMKETIEEDCDELQEDEIDLPFEELIEEYSCYKEDIVCELISNIPEVEKMAIPQLFFHISEMWNLEVIESVFNGTY